MNKIEIQEDFNHQKISWRIKKIGFIIIFLLVILASLGLFGTGFLSATDLGNKNYAWLSYEKFTRAGSPAEIDIHFSGIYDSTFILLINNNDLNFLIFYFIRVLN